MIDKIIALLEELKSVYGELYDMSKLKQKHLIANEAQEVSDIIKEEWSLMSRATDLEDERTAAVKELLGRDEEQSSFEDIMKMATPAQHDALKKAAMDLKEMIGEQKKLNAENQSLIELHLEYMEYMINTVLKEPEVSNIYGNSGTLSDRAIDPRSILDSEA